jgi:predicted outer membrane repeat protein
MKKRIFALVCLLLAIPCQARIITVDNDGPADFNNIQAAINDANNGDTIIVADGTYTGNGNRDIDFNYKSITVRSANGPTNCTVDCQAGLGDEHYGFSIFCSSPNCILDGFTITGGATTNFYRGGGASIGKYAIVRNCIFRENYAEDGGGAIYAGASCDGTGTAAINCTFVNNIVAGGGGAVRIRGGHGDTITLRNCISWANSSPDLAVQNSGKCGVPTIHADFSILQSDWYWAKNCIVADPCFADPCNGDYHLKSQAGRWDPTSQTWVQDDVTSIAIDAGNPADPVGPEPFPNGGFINMGAYGGTSEASKSYFGGPVCQTIVAGDINGDCIVDFKDFAIMALHWLNNNNP